MEFRYSITSNEELLTVLQESEKSPEGVIIFKHSTRCSISAAAINRFQKIIDELEEIGIKSYYLDLIRYREVSNFISSELGVHHESPQIILVKDNKAVRDTSHFDISRETIFSWLDHD